MFFLLDTGSPDAHNSGMEVPANEIFDLRQQAGYWRAQHERAVQRVSALETKAADLNGMVRALKAEEAPATKKPKARQAKG